MRLTITLFLAIISLSCFAQPSITLEEVTSSVVRPVSVTNAGDSRLFLVEQRGQIMILDTSGFVNAAPYLDIRTKVNDSGNEQGLLGLAFPPNFEETLSFYVYYTSGSGTGRSKVARYSVDSVDAPTVDPATEEILLDFNQPFSNHNGGDLNFGPDGFLYISSGDGGFFDDPGNNGQNENTFLGKILRIDVDTVQTYRIPPDNPFAGQTNKKEEIWSLGLRNPWRFSFDRETGDMWIADVGQDETEEVNFEPVGTAGGVNYGWRCYEGSDQYIFGGCGGGDYTFPIFEYPHQNDIGGISITGGFVYRGMDYPEVSGSYFVLDYVTGNTWVIYRDDETGDHTTLQIGDAGTFISGFGEDAQGELYVAGLTAGAIYKLQFSCPETALNPTISQEDASLVCDIMFGQFQWLANGQPIPGATENTYTPPGGSEDTFSVEVVIVNQGCREIGVSNELTLEVTSGIFNDALTNLVLTPNPASTYIEMNWDHSYGRIDRVLLTDLLGRAHSITYSLHGDKLRLEWRNLAQGHYQLAISTDEGKYGGRFLVH